MKYDDLSSDSGDLIAGETFYVLDHWCFVLALTTLTTLSFASSLVTKLCFGGFALLFFTTACSMFIPLASELEVPLPFGMPPKLSVFLNLII